MIPYADFSYWGLLLYPTLPAFLVAWGRRLRQVWILLATVAMLAVQYSAERTIGDTVALREVWFVFGVAVYQFVLATAFLAVRSRTNARWLAWPAAALALAPLVQARVAPADAPMAFIGASYLVFRSLDVIIGIQDRLISELPPVRVHRLRFSSLRVCVCPSAPRSARPKRLSYN